jgi:hypothetical protein
LNGRQIPNRLRIALSGGLALVLLITSCCDDKIVKSAHSPDHRYEARLVGTNCGATSSFVSTVWLRSTEPRFGLFLMGNKEDTVYAVEIGAKHIIFE